MRCVQENQLVLMKRYEYEGVWKRREKNVISEVIQSQNQKCGTLLVDQNWILVLRVLQLSGQHRVLC
jgi:hypothetical protein